MKLIWGSFDVGSTSPVPDKSIKRRSPRATIGNANRFKSTYLRYKERKKVPHSYLSNLKEILGRKSQRPNIELQQTLTNPANLGIASSIPKSTRFSTFESTGPGPADYNLVSTTKSTKLFSSKSGRAFRKQNKCKFAIFPIPKLITMNS